MDNIKIVDDRDINKFRSELRELLNRYSVDNACNTEDFLLADLIIDNLITYKSIVDRIKMLRMIEPVEV